MGYCYDGWWLNRQFCCWEIENDDAGCESWHRWSTVLPVRWTVYVIFAVSTLLYTVANDSAQRAGYIFLHRGPPCAVDREVCGGVWYIRDQVYYRRIHHERVLGLRNFLRQEHYLGK